MTTNLLCVPKICIDKNCLTDVEPEMIWTLDHEYTGQITKRAANFLTFLDNNMDKFNCLGSHSFAETYRSDEQEDLLSVCTTTRPSSSPMWTNTPAFLMSCLLIPWDLMLEQETTERYYDQPPNSFISLLSPNYLT